MLRVNSQDITLQLASLGDAQAIATLSRDLIECGLGWEYRPERIRELVAARDTVTLVARDGDRLMGFAIMSYGEECAHLILMAVRPAGQRRGIARRMTQWLLETAATAGIASVHLELRAQNKDGFAFYRALGFSETLRLPGYYGGRETAIRMIRVLRAPGAALPAWRPPRR
ncbi:MAG TPA: GNAT family N-acetyltransferase [Casimicrobiaceae bacterium]|nr:GNAT family N-acetyltransferase [Casimicrobiaceae bacterium]